MDIHLSVCFGLSHTPAYEQALEYAALFDGFAPMGADAPVNTIATTNHEILAKFDLFQTLLTTIGDWKSAKVLVQEREYEPLAFLEAIKPIAACHRAYQQTADKEAYCDDGSPDCWGCLQLRQIILRHADLPYDETKSYWYQYGSYASKTIWTVDKEMLARALNDIIEVKHIWFCPVFQNTMFRNLLLQLPNSIDTTDTKHWGQKYLDEVISDFKRWLPTNVRHKSAPAPSVEKKHPAPDTGRALDFKKIPFPKRDGDLKLLRYIPDTSFEDIGGIEDIIQNIREVIELPIRQPQLYDHLGIKPFRGILLWGEPGNGKTLIAKAIAHEVKAHFIPLAGPDILHNRFGESEKTLKIIFEEARRLQPSIIFIDEIDAIAQSRLAGENSKWYATVVNQLLALMDGIQEFGNVRILASTNRPDLLDPALLRPGRFDYKLEIKKPNLHGCKKILDIITKGMPLATDVDLYAFSEIVIGLSAADITFIAREAALVAIRRNLDINSLILEDSPPQDFTQIQITKSDFNSAMVTWKRNNKYTNKTFSLKG